MSLFLTWHWQDKDQDVHSGVIPSHVALAIFFYRTRSSCAQNRTVRHWTKKSHRHATCSTSNSFAAVMLCIEQWKASLKLMTSRLSGDWLIKKMHNFCATSIHNLGPDDTVKEAFPLTRFLNFFHFRVSAQTGNVENRLLSTAHVGAVWTTCNASLSFLSCLGKSNHAKQVVSCVFLDHLDQLCPFICWKSVSQIAGLLKNNPVQKGPRFVYLPGTHMHVIFNLQNYLMQINNVCNSFN